MPGTEKFAGHSLLVNRREVLEASDWLWGDKMKTSEECISRSPVLSLPILRKPLPIILEPSSLRMAPCTWTRELNPTTMTIYNPKKSMLASKVLLKSLGQTWIVLLQLVGNTEKARVSLSGSIAKLVNEKRWSVLWTFEAGGLKRQKQAPRASVFP